jgi:signal transduction histidine kinase
MPSNKRQDQIEQLNQEAWHIRVNDSVKALALSGQAILASRAIDYTKGLAEALRTNGFCLIRQSRHEEALTCLDESLLLFNDLGDEKGQSVIYEYYGIIARSKGDFKSSLEYLYTSYQLRQRNHYAEGEALSLYHLGVTYRYLGNLEKALDFFLQSLDVAKKGQIWIAESYAINNIGTIYLEMGNPTDALDYIQQSLVIREAQGDQWGASGCLDNIGRIYFQQGDYDLARNFFSRAISISSSVSDKKGQANVLLHQAELEMALGNSPAAKDCAAKCLDIRVSIGDRKGQAEALLLLIDLYEDEQKLPLLNEAMELAIATGSIDLQYKIHGRYYKYHKTEGEFELALEQLEAYNQAEKEFHSQALAQKMANLQLSHQVEQSQKESEIYRLKNIDLASTLLELRTTQKQLIQAEKMASLGELTAGVAHEIQNPLNFVNNFSDLNQELVLELKDEIARGNMQEVEKIADSIRENEAKINHHGKRADAIVKNMLQHSRSSNGQMELTDLNALCDEYLRLSYHGLRAKDKNFSASLETDYGLTVGKVKVIPQDIGRVLLNLFNNAFYAVVEKKKYAASDYDPTVSISTRRMDNSVQIILSDNGSGIPEKLQEKIFQPFFTTKPTGQGTGLGLSLSYDIIKAHGGELKVESEPQKETIFTIILPV